MKHTLKEIVKAPLATLYHICEGKAVYQIKLEDSIYFLTLDTMEDDWKSTFLMPEMRTIHLMRWIRRGIENNDDTFIQIK